MNAFLYYIVKQLVINDICNSVILFNREREGEIWVIKRN